MLRAVSIQGQLIPIHWQQACQYRQVQRRNARGQHQEISWWTHPKKEEGKNQGEKPKSDQANADPSEDERIYGIDRMNLGEPAHDLEIDSKLILAQLMEVHMTDKENRNNCTKRECNVLYSFLNPTKRA